MTEAFGVGYQGNTAARAYLPALAAGLDYCRLAHFSAQGATAAHHKLALIYILGRSQPPALYAAPGIESNDDIILAGSAKQQDADIDDDMGDLGRRSKGRLTPMAALQAETPLVAPPSLAARHGAASGPVRVYFDTKQLRFYIFCGMLLSANKTIPFRIKKDVVSRGRLEQKLRICSILVEPVAPAADLLVGPMAAVRCAGAAARLPL